jgi:hypothetical protein
VRRHVALVTKMIGVLLDQLFQGDFRQRSGYHAWSWNEIILRGYFEPLHDYAIRVRQDLCIKN